MTMSNVESLIAEIVLGASAPVRRLRAMIARIAAADVPVLIHGPTGSGKEVVAHAIHLASQRSGAFVAFNVCALSDTMFEDALFGHVRGAFTGANGPSTGFLGEAHRGTLFLDEIGALGLAAQAKLLRALETKCFRPIGASLDRQSDFRLVAATNADLDSLISTGAFREDLRYRLGVIVLEVPPLSARPEDIPLLADHFLHLASRRVPFELSSEANRRLEHYDWPGNVRELKQVIEAVVAVASGPRITSEDFDTLVRDKKDGKRASFEASFFDRRMLAVLDSTGWRVADAARELGVSARSVYRRLKRLGVTSPEDIRTTRIIHPSMPVFDATTEA